MSAAISHQLPIGEAECAAGRANYEAFTASMSEWLPDPPVWETLSQRVRDGWIAGAKAARAS